MEIVPSITIDPTTGAEVIDYNNASVIDHSYRDQIQREHRALEQRAIYEDENGIHSAFADAITQDGSYEEQIEQQPTEDEVDNTFEQFQNGIFEQLGGEQNYQKMVSWAANNWLADDIRDYDAVFDGHDYELMLQAIQFLYNDYSKYN